MKSINSTPKDRLLKSVMSNDYHDPSHPPPSDDHHDRPNAMTNKTPEPKKHNDDEPTTVEASTDASKESDESNESTDNIKNMTPPPNNDWVDFCKTRHSWCLNVINAVLHIRDARKKMFPAVTTPTLNDNQKAEVRKKCHEDFECRKRISAKLKETMLRYYLLERIGMETSKPKSPLLIAAIVCGIIILLIVSAVVYVWLDSNPKKKRFGKQSNKSKAGSKGSFKTNKNNKKASISKRLSCKTKNSSKKSTITRKSKSKKSLKSKLGGSQKLKNNKSIKSKLIKSKQHVYIKMPASMSKK